MQWGHRAACSSSWWRRSIGAYTPADAFQVPLLVGLLSMGTLLACLIAFFYSVHTLRWHAPRPVPQLPPPTFDFVVFDSVVIGVFVGISLALAQALRLEKAYWCRWAAWR